MESSDRARNTQFVDWMTDQGFTAAELARLLNDAIGEITGRQGTLIEGTIRRWRSGDNRWPREVQRRALAQLSGRSPASLGFIDPSTRRQEADVDRRAFLGSSTGAVAAIALPSGRRIGSADVRAAEARLDALSELDDQRGGHADLRNAALATADRILARQQEGTASDNVRRRLYAVAADCTAMAAWSCIDDRDHDRAQAHLDRAMTLGGLAQDSSIQFHIWCFMATLANQRGQYTQSLAAAQAARATSAARRDPLLASLAHARAGLAHARMHEHTAARRNLSYAEKAFAKAPMEPRTAWSDFYTRGELHGLTGLALAQADDHEQAEYHLYQCLAALRPDQHRNRAHYTAQVALVQLAQGDARQACATADAAATMPTSDNGRTLHLLRRFAGTLRTVAPGSRTARDWADRHPPTTR
ncbi:XRE family transcriptional regulator [Streptomyces sp. NPDC049577]|uniref:XRE family transcriptional regulator n=1 Tax=Streptomyces sp. NPDC049577 TaxID=3155153 RepID=UPI003444BDD1